MTLLKQSLVMSRLSLATLPQRFWPALIIVLSMTCVAGVLVAMLSETVGLHRTYLTGGSADRAIVMPSDSLSEYGNGISRNDATTIMSAPGIARRRDGSLVADPEILFWVPPTEGYRVGSPELRGVGAAGLALRPGFVIVSGRSFQPGRQELIVGVRARHAFGLRVGDKVILPNGEWPIVGAFAAGGGILEGELVGDANTIMQTSSIAGFGSILVQLDPVSAFPAFRHWLTTNPALTVTVERQSDYYLRTASRYSAFFTYLAYTVGAIMGLGALFGSVKLMHASVSTRTREIATLRALGYRPLSCAIAILFEMSVLSLAGACLGVGIAWLLFNGKVMTGLTNAFDLSVSPGLILLGLGWGLSIAILGSLPPAIRAARLSVVDALREV